MAVLGGGAVSYERGTPVVAGVCCPRASERVRQRACGEREFFIDNLLVRIHFIFVMIRWTGLAPWGFELPFPGSLTSTFLDERCWRDQKEDAHNAHSFFTSSASAAAVSLCLSLLCSVWAHQPSASTHQTLVPRGASPGVGAKPNRPRQRLKGPRRPGGASRCLQRARGPASRSRH